LTCPFSPRYLAIFYNHNPLSSHPLSSKARDDERAAARAREKDVGSNATRALANVGVSSEVGRRVKFALEQVEELRQLAHGGATALQHDAFLPRRTTYVFNMLGCTPDEAYSVMPILVTRSKGACLQPASLHPIFVLAPRICQCQSRRLNFPPNLFLR
jgi:hypothetical protein